MKYVILLLLATLATTASAEDGFSPNGYTPQRATELQRRPTTQVDVEKSKQLLQRIDKALFGFSTMHARFRQTSNKDGHIAMGEMWLMRPGKTRWDYYSPNASQIFINDDDLVYFDRDLEQVTHADSPDTPMTLLLEKGASLFDPRIRIVELKQQGGNTSIALVENRPDIDPFSMLGLVFDTQTMTLQRIHSTDASNLTTTISLDNVRFDVDVSERDFKFTDPRRISERGRRKR